jgi:hypothetical protein
MKVQENCSRPPGIYHHDRTEFEMPNDPPMKALVTRRAVLAELGFQKTVSRASWSHDDGARIIFDAWEHRFVGSRYPMQTREHYRVDEYGTRRGLTRWIDHLNLVRRGQRVPILINPVPNDPTAQPNKGARGWLPQYCEGNLVDEDGETWFEVRHVHTLTLAVANNTF